MTLQFGFWCRLAAAAALFCLTVPGSQAQSRETLLFSLQAYDKVLENLQPGQDSIAIGDMLMDVAEAREIRAKLQAKLDGKLSAQGAFDFSANKAWPNGVVPYAYDKSVPSAVRTLFESAIREWQENANLNFVLRGSQANYLLIKFTGYSNNAAMNSYIGMRGKAQDLNVAGWGNKIDCAHELGHALGMAHEQCRSDRDIFVSLIATNLDLNPATDINYAIVPSSINRTDYDFDSLMHYPRSARAKDAAFPTMLARPPYERWTDGAGPEEIGQKSYLSAGDKVAMAAQYGAPLSIGGRVADPAGNPLAGVQVTLTGGSPYRGANPIVTDADGKYAFTGVPKNSGAYAVSVSQAGVTFTEHTRPASVDELSHTQVNFTSVDTAPPDLFIDVPGISDIYASTPQASGRASDTVALKEVRLALARTSDLVWWNWNEGTWGGTTFDWSKHAHVANGKTTWTGDLPNLPVGGYQLHVQSVDLSDNASTWKFRHFFVDPEPPVVAVMQPLPSSTIPEFAQLRGTATDRAGAGIKDNKVYFTLYQDGDFWTGFNWKKNTDAQDPDVLLSADVVDGQWIYNSIPGRDHHSGGSDGNARHGKFHVSLFARDNAGNLSQPTPGVNSVEFTVDHSPPSVSITFPSDGSTVTNITSISGAASDSSSLQTVRLYIYRYRDGQFWDGTTWGGGGSAILPVTIDANQGTWTSSGALPSIHSHHPATRLSNGGYNIMAFAVDSAGNQTRADIVVTIQYYPEVTYNEGSFRDSDPFNNNENWDNPANWDLGFVPGPEEVAVIKSGRPMFSGEKTIHALDFSGGEIRGGKIIIPRDGTFTWSGGTLSADLSVQEFAQFNLSGTADKTIASGRRVENFGDGEWTGNSRLTGSGGIVFVNYGAIRMEGDLGVLYYNNGVFPIASFENQGSFTKSGPGTLRFLEDYGGWAFTNGASLKIEEGAIIAHNNTYLGGTISGAGRLIADKATFHLHSAVALDGGTVELKSGKLIGTGSFNGTGTFVWSGGSLEGDLTIEPDAHLSFTGADRALASGAILRQRGSATWDSGSLNTAGNARFENSGRLDIIGSVVATFYNNGVFPRAELLNTGLVTINGGSNVRFTADYGGMHFSNQNGEIRVLDGFLSLGGGGVNTNATYEIQNGSIDLVSGERHRFAGQIALKGSGRLRVHGASLTWENAAFAVAAGSTFEHATGTTEGSFSITGPGTFVWSGGTLNASIDLTDSLATQISSDAEKNLESGKITHRGNLTWSGAGAIRAVGAAEFRNLGLFEARSDAAFLFYNNGVFPRARFVNEGLLRKSSSEGYTRFLADYGGWELINRGTLDIQTGAIELRVPASFEHGGRFSGAGSTRVMDGSAVIAGTNQLAGGTLELNGGTLSSEGGWIEGQGTLLWTGGTVAGAINVDATNFALRGDLDKTIASGSTVRTFGTASWSGAGALRLTGASVLENRGHFESLADTTLFYYNNGVFPKSAFVNLGIFVKSAGTNALSFPNDYGGAAFNNTGTISIQSGRLDLGGGGSWDRGEVSVATGSELRLFSGSFRLTGQNTFAGFTSITGAEMNLAEATNTLAATSVLNLASGSIVGAGLFDGPGTLEWTGGTMSGSFVISDSARWALDGQAEKRFYTGTIENHGTATWNGTGPLKAEGAALLNNHGTFTLLSDAGFLYYNNGVFPRARFHNYGTLRKSGGAAESIFLADYGGWNFSNDGVLQIDVGMLTLRTESFLTNSIVRGSGKIFVTGGPVTLQGTTHLDGGMLELAGGRLVGENTFAGTGRFDWTGGELHGTHTIAQNTTARFSSPDDKILAGSSTLENRGTIDWLGSGALRGVGQSRFLNHGLLDLQNTASFIYYNNGVFPGALFENSGTLRKSSSAPATFVGDYGGWSFTNRGTLHVGIGTLNVGPRYEPAESARLLIGLGHPDHYGNLVFPTAATLSGQLQLQLADYTPPIGKTFTLATYPNRTGQFTSPALPALPAGQGWKIEYLADKLNLTVIEETTVTNSGFSKPLNGQFQLTVTGAPGQYALFQSTTNLIDWSTLATNQPFTGQFQFTDIQATNLHKFYRTVIVP